MSTSANDAGTLPFRTSVAQRAATGAFAALALVYLVVFARFESFPYQDFPNHLTRATVLADLLFQHGATFGAMFDFRFMPVPYILGDLLLAGLVQLFGPGAAGTIWLSIVLLSWPAALLFYARATGISRNAQGFLLLLSLYLATDWFFLLAFTQYRLGIALMLVALGVAHLLRQRWTMAGFTAFCVLLAVGYFTHLIYVIFLAPCLVVSATVRLYFRQTSLRRELMLLAPVLLVMAWHFGMADRLYRSDGIPAYTWLWGTPALKAWGLQLELLRFGDPFAKILMILFTAAVCWGLWRDVRWRTLWNPAVLESIALAVTFLGIYIVLPSRYSQAAYVDVRALAMITLFIVLARVQLSETAGVSRANTVAITLAALLAALNLFYLSQHLSRHESWDSGYRAILPSVPKGSTVLPIYTSGREGSVAPRLHMSSYLVMDRAALMPYLFSGDGGHPMKYFRYRHKPYAPLERWYNAEVAVPVDWDAIQCSYEYLLIDKPYDAARIPILTSVVAENSSAALLAVRRSPAMDSPPGTRNDHSPCWRGAAAPAGAGGVPGAGGGFFFASMARDTR